MWAGSPQLWCRMKMEGEVWDCSCPTGGALIRSQYGIQSRYLIAVLDGLERGF